MLDLLKKSSLHQPSFCSQQEDSVEDLRQECVEAPLKEKQHHRKQVEFLKLSHEDEYLADGMIYISIDAHANVEEALNQEAQKTNAEVTR